MKKGSDTGKEGEEMGSNPTKTVTFSNPPCVKSYFGRREKLNFQKTKSGRGG